MIHLFKKLLNKGFFHIFGSNIVNRVINFSSSILLVRILTKSNYGVWSAAENILQIFLLLQGLGVTAGLLQYASENQDPKKQYVYFKTSLFIGIITNIIASLGILIYYFFGKFSIPNSKPYFLLLFLLPLFNIIFDIIMIFLRIRLENKLYSFLNTLNSAFVLIFTVSGAYFFKITGVVLGRYLAVIFVIIYATYKLKNILPEVLKSAVLVKNELIDFLKYSATCLVANVFTSIYLLVDVFFIGFLLKDENIVAIYKTATLIPFALLQIPSSVIVFLFPFLAQRLAQPELLKELYYKIVRYMIIVNCIIVSILFFLAPFLIKLMFGVAFIDAVIPFRILLLGYLVNGSIKLPSGNTLFAMKKVTTNITVVVITGSLNILFDYFLIKKYGMIGASLSSLMVAILSSTMLFIAIRYHFKILLKDKK